MADEKTVLEEEPPHAKWHYWSMVALAAIVAFVAFSNLTPGG